ncbi:unnamed protein product [Mytilus edulis]|uniref:Uncharacterized protein n=1 Tax=Mytilus edulis TaxID=6550 RepID=A0A8S3UUL4_MYTED|nr:unnamed protein product [Mytilus edulis]
MKNDQEIEIGFTKNGFTKHKPGLYRKELATQNESIALYHNLCQKIVGTEEHVKTLRLMNTIRDYLYSTTNENIIITSGSFGEGLEMRGSDLDVMSVTKCMEVYGETQIDKNTNKLHFTMDIEDTHPGFTKLRILNFSGNDDDSILKFFDKIGSDVYLSSFLPKIIRIRLFVNYTWAMLNR